MLKPTEQTMKNPTFQEFVDTAFQAVFNALITGGTASMKAQLEFYISQAVRIANDGGFAKPK
jgi:hypothetical protein